MNISFTKRQLERIINEMATPTDFMKEKMWFHGTGQENGEKILQTKVLKPSERVTKKSRGYMTPVFNKTYLTADLDEAVRYALFRSEVDEIPYLIGVSGENLKDVQPDEDIIADLLQTEDTIKGFEWLENMANYVDKKVYDRFKWRGDYALSVLLAKKIVKNLPDYRKIELINKGLKLAHEGEIPVTTIWQLPPLENRFDSALGKDISYYIDNRHKVY